MFLIKTKAAGTGPILRPDDFLLSDNNGVRFLFDSASKLSYAGGVPAAGTALKDVSQKNVDAAWVVASGQAANIGYNGNGFDFSGLTDDGVYIALPAQVMADLDNSQEFLYLFEMMFPTAENWTPGSVIVPLVTSSNAAQGTSFAGADPLRITAAQGALRAEWSASAGTTSAVASITPDADNFGKLCLVAAWRQAGRLHLVLIGEAQTKHVDVAAAADNIDDLTARVLKFGIVPQGWANNGSAWPVRNHRLYRGGVENLALSARSPLSYLPAERARTVARAVFS